MNSQPRPIRLGIVGLQHLHPRFQASLFKSVPDIIPVAVCESDVEIRQAFCADLQLTGYASLEEMLTTEPLDAVSLYLPHADFPDVAVRCAEKGLHLMVDKPMAATTEGAEKIVRAAERNKVQLTTAYYFRAHPFAEETRKLVQSGVIGRVISGGINWLNGGVERYLRGHSGWMLDKNRSGGGPLHNLGVHWIDMLRYILGDEVISATGRTLKFSDEYSIEDVSTAQLEFSSGPLISLYVAYLDLVSKQPSLGGASFSLLGTQGRISWNVFTKSDQLTVTSDNPRFSDQTMQAPADCNIFEFMGLKYVNAFVRAIRGEHPMFVTGNDGVAALRVVEAVYRSAQTLQWEQTVQ